MKLAAALNALAKYGNLNYRDLLDYVQEDKVTGCEEGYYSSISVTRDEGRILYAMVRALKPKLAVEIGSHSGCSSTHILSAMEKNGMGHLHSLDLHGIQPPGIPEELQYRWSIDHIDARYYLWPTGVEFVFEDGDHTRDLTGKVIASAVHSGAKAIFAHDAYNDSVGSEVCGAFSENVTEYHKILLAGPRLGLACWFREE